MKMCKPLLRTQSLTLRDRNILCWTGWEIYLNRVLAMKSHVTERTVFVGQRPAETSRSEEHAADGNNMCGFHNHNTEWRHPNTTKTPMMQLHPREILEDGVAWPRVQKRGTRHGTHNMGRKGAGRKGSGNEDSSSSLRLYCTSSPVGLVCGFLAVRVVLY